MRRAQDVRKQLLGIMERYKHEIISCGRNSSTFVKRLHCCILTLCFLLLDRVRRAICAGYFRHAAKKDPQEGFKTLVEGTPIFIHPSSALFNRQPYVLPFTHHECMNVLGQGMAGVSRISFDYQRILPRSYAN